MPHAPPSTTQTESSSETLRRRSAPPRAPTHVPPVPLSQSPDAGRCACGGSCPRCAPAQTFSSLVRSATEETGAPLPSGVAHRLQSRFRQTVPDLSIHRGPDAQRAASALGTRAFTHGNDIALAASAPDVTTPEGFALLVHETVHALQQRGPSSRDPQLGSDRTLERDAVQASRAAGPSDVAADSRSHGTVQREEPDASSSALHPFTSQGMFQLHLDPEIERELFRIQFRRWMAQNEAQTQSSQQSATPSPDAGSGSDSATPAPDPGPDADPGHPLDSRWYTPELFSAQPDVGALLGSFNTRGVGARPGDVDIALQLFQDRYRFVSALPDLRDIVPDFARSWVPSNWRLKLAESLTNMTIDSALRHDNPTFIEASDQMLLNLTGDPGVVPTYIKLPAISF